MLLTFEYSGDGREIRFDEEGGELLLARISKLLMHNAPDHDHPVTPARSG